MLTFKVKYYIEATKDGNYRWSTPYFDSAEEPMKYVERLHYHWKPDGIIFHLKTSTLEGDE